MITGKSRIIFFPLFLFALSFLSSSHRANECYLKDVKDKSSTFLNEDLKINLIYCVKMRVTQKTNRTIAV